MEISILGEPSSWDENRLNCVNNFKQGQSFNLLNIQQSLAFGVEFACKLNVGVLRVGCIDFFRVLTSHFLWGQCSKQLPSSYW